MGIDELGVSVVIRTRDIERHLYELLDMLRSQTLRPSEIVIVDNFSTRKTLEEMIEFLRSAKTSIFDDEVQIKLVPISDDEFSYAYSANIGVWASQCEHVCITNGHCLPISESWLENGVSHFRNPEVAGVAGYTLPHRYGTIWEKLAFDLSWRRLMEKSRAYVRDTFFSTTNCILRRSLWAEYSFDEKMPDLIENAGKFGGEDYDWALEMLARGYKLVVEPRFDVYHSHGESLSQLVSKYLVWRRIRKEIRSLKRPRKSYTRLRDTQPRLHQL
jgi:glycosyltransferase involved in cell wall biosynthesis